MTGKALSHVGMTDGAMMSCVHGPCDRCSMENPCDTAAAYAVQITLYYFRY